MKIFLIRHGETTGDVEQRYGGMYDDSLTQRGKEQLLETAQKLTGKKIVKLYSSTLKRAKESANIINGVLKTQLEFSDGLRERDYGVLGGLTKQEAMEKYPEAVELHTDPAHTDPGGESLVDFTERVLNTFEEILNQSHESIAVVAHGGPIKIILGLLAMPIPEKITDGEIIEVSLD